MVAPPSDIRAGGSSGALAFIRAARSDARMAGRDVYIAHTHRVWFDFLSRYAQDGRLDEVNFWFPNAQRPPRRFADGDPVFFRLGAPHRKICGYGFLAYLRLPPPHLSRATLRSRTPAEDRTR